MNLNELLNREEAATMLRVSVRTVDRLIEAGELPAARVGRAVRVARADVQALLTPTAPVQAGPHSPGAGVLLSSLPGSHPKLGRSGD